MAAPRKARRAKPPRRPRTRPVPLAAVPAEAGAWVRFYARYALAVALALVALVVVFFGAVVFLGPDPTLGPDYTDLRMADLTPVLWLLFGTLDWLGWLLISGSLVLLGQLARPRAPVRAALVTALGVANFIGVAAAVVRLMGVADAADRFAAASAATEEQVLADFRQLQGLYGALFAAGQVTQGLGFVLAGTALARLPWMPPWLGRWVVLPGLTSAALFVVGSLGTVAADVLAWFFPILVVHILVGVAGSHFAFAARFWDVGGRRR